MKWRGVNELREAYLSFFESKAHTRMDSASLVPQGDKSLLLINSGMAPLKKYFLGQTVPPNKRVTTCQKCIRTPDIECVGKTARHGTYFEMLGNFSFGDYFKEQAIEWAWEFLTGTLEIPAEKLWITIFESDDEAEQIWEKKIGIPHDRIIRLGKKDNFWEHGSGPCGPCSEIHFDRGEKYGPFESFEQASDCDRVIEIWNLVFSQFDSDGNGNYTEMKNKNIDTGMGLERLACVMQGVDNLFEVDTVQKIMKHISDIAGVTYKEDDKTDVSLRVITDHIRSTVFMVGDGVLPSNEGRGYVLRRLLRRAARHGRMLGITKPFLFEVCDTVINENKSAYPELSEKADYIKKIIKIEEESFSKTIDKGTEMLDQLIDKIGTKKLERVLSGDDVFKLSDTYGFPIDLISEIAFERNVKVDEARFNVLVQEQKAKARADHAAKAGSSWKGDSAVKIDADATVFTGYKSYEDGAVVKAIIVDGKLVDKANAGDNAAVVLDKTPFYAESGGQVGDAGEIEGSGLFAVGDTKKIDGGHYLHLGTVERDSISVGETVTAKIDGKRRDDIKRNHTAAHLLQAALREVLGNHVHQAGQLVNSERCRFDFSHFSAMTTEEIQCVENIVNEKILSAIDVITKEMPITEARKLGAMALFGEKYGDVVRVVDIENTSVEFCGGTHASNTSDISLFKIVSESSVASGVRRIEGVTGRGVLGLINEYKNLLIGSATALKTANIHELPEKCAATVNDIKDKEREIESLNQKIISDQFAGIFENAADIYGVKIVSALFNGTKPDTLKKLGDKIKESNEDTVAVFAGISDDKGTFFCACSKGAISKGAHAGNIVKRVSAITGGNGGGRPDSAMAGIGKNYMIDEALGSLESIVREILNIGVK